MSEINELTATSVAKNGAMSVSDDDAGRISFNRQPAADTAATTSKSHSHYGCCCWSAGGACCAVNQQQQQRCAQ